MEDLNSKENSEKELKKLEKIKDKILMGDLDIDRDELKALKKKLSKISPRPERGVETLFRLVSKNQYTLNAMIDRKSNILISVNALILSIIIGTVYAQMSTDPHLIYPVVMILITNLISIAYAIFATRPELKHGNRASNNLMFYGNFHEMEEEKYVDSITALMNQGDELYRTIAKDTYHLGRTINRKFKYLRTSFHVFLFGIVLSVMAFIACHVFFA